MRFVSAPRPFRRAALVTLSSLSTLVLLASACSEVPERGESTSRGGTGGTTSGGVGGTSPAASGGKAGTAPSGGAGTGSSGAASGGQAAAAGAGSVGGAAGQGSGGASALGGSAGTGSAAAGTGGGSAGMPPRGPTPPTATSRFPFPQNRQSAHCTYPINYDNEDVKKVYAAWKQDLVTKDGAGGFSRVKRPAEHGLDQDSTVSEGIAYGMLIAVYMDDQPLFDDFWKYQQLHTWQSRPPGGQATGTMLMNWYILKDGNTGGSPDGNGAATDADEDMAWALIMADKQWGGQGSLGKSYIDTAKQLLGDIWKYEVDNGRLPKNGSSWGNDNSLNISYFAPSYYRVFAKVSGEARWGKEVVDYVYQVIGQNLNDANGNKTNGLVPAFSRADGSPAEVGSGQSGLAFNYQYDSCRTPFRIGLDACGVNDTRALDYVAKTSSFFGALGAPNIVDGYELNGTPKPQFPDGFGGLSAAFIGPAAVGAMHSSSYQGFINDAWGLLKLNNMWCGGQYYDESWTILSMLMLSGNFLDYTEY